MKEIPLTQGKVALVDDSDYEELNKHKWYAHRHATKGRFYARRNTTINGERITIRMHRQLLGIGEDSKVLTDHLDNNGLNNQRNNIRITNTFGNQWNKGKQINNTSGYKGISWHKQRQKWYASIKTNNQLIYLGVFVDINDAVAAYKQAEALLHCE